MKQDFLKLISILIDQQPGGLVGDYQVPFHSLCQRFNDVLKVTKEEEMFHTEMTYEEKSYLIPPVPFASTNEKSQPLAFAILGLNPKLFLKNDITIQEKKYAGGTWNQYATFYTTINRNEHDIGNFYRNLTVLMQSLKNGRLVTWPEFVKGCRNKQERLERFNINVEKDPLLVGELIPFHSSKIGTLNEKNLQKLFQEVNEYKQYLNALLTIIFNKLDSNGWLIANGKGASAALEIFIENKLLKGEFHKVLDKRTEKYTCYIWEHEGAYRKVLLLHNFLRTPRGAFNSNEQIKELILTVIDSFNNWKQRLEPSI
ncbi:hypothetical protein [Bacillus sp. UNC438CL73TsuS30]|uniref:hypothetical protein n=1 Tax=Bacillus sp. UNC438CL73TsuS30 TaxID=1340434 RepID=UPI00047A577C|nr:hypothetical protein [Bacillus sp. UNC438CL73TsuS30]